MKKIFLLITIFILSGCGYSSVYKEINKEEIKISIKSLNGDQILNNLLRTKLKNFTSSNSNKNYILNINSVFIRSVTSKDKTGRATNVQLIARIEFDISLNEIQKNLIYEEKINIENSSNSYEQKNYEKSIKNSFVNSIVNKLILQLTTI